MATKLSQLPALPAIVGNELLYADNGSDFSISIGRLGGIRVSKMIAVNTDVVTFAGLGLPSAPVHVIPSVSKIGAADNIGAYPRRDTYALDGFTVDLDTKPPDGTYELVCLVFL